MRTIELTDEQLEALQDLLSVGIDEKSYMAQQAHFNEDYTLDDIEAMNATVAMGEQLVTVLDKAWL